jgi:2-succinyl-6-hydroxy-2,4-cyclohexadiene-1-carboxylate synthase
VEDVDPQLRPGREREREWCRARPGRDDDVTDPGPDDLVGQGGREGSSGVRATYRGTSVSREALHVEVVGAGPRLVLVHGFTQTGRSWRLVAEDLSRGHEVLLVDAPGHGGSSQVRADLWAGAALLADAGGEAVYVGYSMGGRLALHLGLARPQLVRGLVLIGATPGIEDGTARAERRIADERHAVDLEREGLDAFLERWLAQPLFARLPREVAGFEDRRANTVDGLASSLRLAGAGAQEPLWDRLTALTMPVLVLAGAEDERFAEIGRRIVSAIGSTATFALVPNAGHAAHLEQPQEVVRLIRAWLSCGT